MEEKQIMVGEHENEMDVEIATNHLEASGMRTSIIKNDDGGMLPLLQSMEGVQFAVDGTQCEKTKR